MADQTTATSAISPPAYVFKPPSGGDILFRTVDGKVFCLHTLILRLASTVFSDMLTIGTQSAEVVDLADDSEAFSLMLGFIYPSAVPPIVNTFALLEKSLQIAQKYQVETMLQKIDRSLSCESSYNDLIQIESFRLFRLCATYGLRQTQSAAARLIRASPDKLLVTSAIIDLAKEHPSSAHLLGALGAQLIYSQILYDVLINTRYCRAASVYVPEDIWGDGWLICGPCRKKAVKVETRSSTYHPGWLHAWGTFAYDVLMYDPWDDDSFLFTTKALEQLPGPGDNERFCSACVKTARNAKDGQVFELWARGIKEELKRRMRGLEDLYVL